MRVVIPQIAWHARDPILTLDFDPKGKTEKGYYRLVTGGADRLLLVWHLTNPASINPEIICVSELTRHQKGINVVRFSPCGTFIAAGDDDSYVYIWKNESVADREEVWNVEKIFRRHVEDVTDLCWSADSNFLVSGSVDNTAVVWDVKKGTPVHFWSEREHTGFVQGVTYDPLGEFVATMCIDRHLRFFSSKTGKPLHKTLKYPPAWLGTAEEDEAKENKPEKPLTSSVEPMEVETKQVSADPLASRVDTLDPAVVGVVSESENSLEDTDKPLSEINGEEPKVNEEEPKINGEESKVNGEEPKLPPKKPVITLNRLFHDDSLKTFCRRLSCSPKGELLIVPGGLLPPVEKKKEESRLGTPVEGEDEDSKDDPAKKFDPDLNNAVIIFCRNSFTNPCAVIPTGLSYSIAARFSPVYYERERKTYEYDPEFVSSMKKSERIMSCIGKIRPSQKEQGILLDMPYRLVYAVATNNSILIGDTASVEPLACVKNIHCTRMTDISWSPDGLVLIASSTDGYCSIVTFEEGELGAGFQFEGEFPVLTPNCFPIAPPEPKPVKVKEPKEPKEKKEKEPKEKKEKEPKDKKESSDKKEAATPTENKEEKKKKPLTIFKMLSKINVPSTTGNSPVAKTPTEKTNVEELQQQTPVGQPLNGTSAMTSESIPSVNNTPKPTFLDSWVKKTPKSSQNEKKQPRRIQLTTVSTPVAVKPSGEVEKDPASEKSNCAASATSLETSAQLNAVKPPRRIQLTTVSTPVAVKPSGEVEKDPASEKSNCVVAATSSETSAHPVAVKPPRRIQLTTVSAPVAVKPSGEVEKDIASVKSNGVVAATSSETLAQPVAVKPPRRIQLTTVSAPVAVKPSGEVEKDPASEKSNGVVAATSLETSAQPKAVKPPRRIQLITLDSDDEPKAKRVATEESQKN